MIGQAAPTRFSEGEILQQLEELEKNPLLSTPLVWNPEDPDPEVPNFHPECLREREETTYLPFEKLNPSRHPLDANKDPVVCCWEDIGCCSPKPSRRAVHLSHLPNLSEEAQGYLLSSDWYLHYLKVHLENHGQQRPVHVSILARI